MCYCVYNPMQCEFEFNDDYCYDYDDDIGELPNLHGKKNKEGVRGRLGIN